MLERELVAHAREQRPVDWRSIYQLLHSGAYEQAAALLYELQVASAAIADQLDVVAIDAVREICLACLQCQAEAEWHRQAEQAAQQREQQLNSHAQALLNKVSRQSLAGSAECGPFFELALAEAVESAYQSKPPLTVRSLMQRVKHLFAPEPPTPAMPSTQEIEGPAMSDPKAGETPQPCQEEEEEEVQTITAPQADVVETETPVGSAPDHDLAATTPLSVEREAEGPERGWPATGDEPEIPPPTVAPITAPLAPEPSMLMIYCFGPFRVYQNDQLIEEWNGLKGQAVLKYLVAHRGTPTAKDVLMDVFWPDTEAEAARRNLHQAIYSLRQTLRRRAPDIQYILFENNQYLLTPALCVWVDVEEFQTHVQSGQRLEAAGQIAAAMLDYGTAESLYQGDYLEEDVYDDWPRPRRERMRTTYLDIADRLSEYYRQQGEYSAAITLCQKILTLDNCVEEAHRRLMRCYLAQGQRHPAIRQYHTCVQALAKELDAPPADETRTLYMSIIKN